MFKTAMHKKDESMKYNLYIETQSQTYNILDVDDVGLGKIIDCYKYGQESFFIKGKKFFLENLFEIQIFTFESDEIENGDDFWKICKQKGLTQSSYFSEEYISTEILGKVGKLVTENYIKNDYGYLQDNKTDNSTELYVDLDRIDEISQIKGQNFDFTKLISLLKELNVAYAHNLVLTIPLLVRSVIDHIPPIFGKHNFDDVCGAYGSRSFRDSMNNLNKSNRKIADAILHEHIRNRESLPTKTQVNFKNDLDVLLQEIVRKTK